MLLVLYNSRFICFNLIMYLSSITISFIFYIFSKEAFLMSLFFSDFIHTRTDLTQKISDIQQQLKQLPHGKLIISHNGENINGIPVMVILKNIFLNLIVHLLSNWRFANISLPC